MRGMEGMEAFQECWVAEDGDMLFDVDDLSPGIKEALAFVHERFHEPISVVAVAEQAKLSYHHLCRKFKKETRMTIVEMVNRLRINRAKELLKVSPDPINEIARKVGFTSTVQFHRTFRKFENDTPMQFRKKAFGEG